MKLASLKSGGRDGTLVVVNRSLTQAVVVDDIASTLQAALDDWDQVAPLLNNHSERINAGEHEDAFDLELTDLAAPLPRAYQFLDGSAYLAHVERVRRARGAEMPPSFLEDPLMYQAVTDGFMSATDDIEVVDEAYGIDFEAEIAVITDDVPMAVTVEQAYEHIQLITILNDVSLRNLIPKELGKGFGFVQSKPRTALAPVFVTPDELGASWRDAKLHLAMRSWLNGEAYGAPEAGEDMQFNFAQLIAHAAKTRPLGSGTIIGSGTIANQDESVGASCLAERRVLEVINNGKATTPFMSFGDSIRIDVQDESGHSIFGAIDQKVVKFEG
ncbi:MAG: fumarylacetoacetate hydrolase family protein [bacterium]